MSRLRNVRHPYPRRPRGRTRRARPSRMWAVALGGCAVALVAAYSLASPGTERAASSANVSAGTAGAAGQSGSTQAGGWSRGGGYQMLPAPAGATANGADNATATTSMNWAGYAATGTPGTFTSVSSSWAEPAVTCGAASTFSSFWVGLDGDGTQTVEQTGTEADCSNGAPTYAGWFEMFPNAPVFYNNPVMPGDAMSASVVANGGGAFTLTLSDATQGWTQTTQQTSATAQLGSAEIIAEAPSNGTVLPLANFGTVNFTNTAVDNAPVGNANVSALTMVSSGGAAEATPSALTGGNSFTVTWDSGGSGAGASSAAAAPSPGTSMASPSPGRPGVRRQPRAITWQERRAWRAALFSAPA
jgi:hypothetical protein